jgi:hypothetical protein
LFLSPYSEAAEQDEVDFYQGLSRTKALVKQRNTPGAPVLPLHLRSEGLFRQHPKEFVGMTREQADIFGSLFNGPGAYWPSGKPTFAMFHMMAFNAFKPKLLPFMFNEAGQFNYEIITHELVDGCEDFDHSYWDELPMRTVTAEEKILLQSKYTGIPPAAWLLMPYWTKDPRACSENVARRRGYM